LGSNVTRWIVTSRGFAPLMYTEIDPVFGSSTDVEHMADRHAVLLDVMIEHISRRWPNSWNS
jgi:sucrose phosphorylase